MIDRPSRDLPPEQLPERTAEAPEPDLDRALRAPDPSGEPEPTDEQIARDVERVERGEEEARAEAVDRYSSVRWPSDDKNAPDYAHIADVTVPSAFSLTADVLEKLIEANSFQPLRDKNTIAFALRGARLAEGQDAENASTVALQEIRPNHRDFCCLIGFYFPGTRKINVYCGSTVPCRKAIFRFPQGGSACNLLPNGLYTYYVWRHKALRPALRLAKSNASTAGLEEGAFALVLRSKNDTVLGTMDIWDNTQPLDNVHCSYFLGQDEELGACFSSWGCLTVRGRKTSTDQWEKFQTVLDGLGSQSQVDLMLVTGKDAAIAAQHVSGDVDHSGALMRLRAGSRGRLVEALQSALGVGVTGFFGPGTREALVKLQQQVNDRNGFGKSADGVYSPQFEKLAGLSVFQPSS